MPGAPCIYYGDEIGLSSADDPLCRQAFPWAAEGTWDTELLAFYRRAIALRQSLPALRTGTFTRAVARGQVYGFRRALPNSEALVFFNAGVSEQTLKLPLAGCCP